MIEPATEPRKILVTGNLNYVGPVVVGRLLASRPETTLIGLDTGFFAHCLTGCRAVPERSLDHQYYGDVRVRRRRSSRAWIPSYTWRRSPMTRSATPTMRSRSASTTRPRSTSPRRRRGRRPPLRLCVKLQHLRRHRGRGRDRGVARRPLTPLCALEMARRAGARADRGRNVRCHQPPLPDRVRDERSPTSRPRTQRLRRLGGRLAADRSSAMEPPGGP